MTKEQTIKHASTLITLALAVMAVIAVFVVRGEQINTNKQRIKMLQEASQLLQIETRANSDLIIRMGTDVSWIRRDLEKR